VTIALPDVDAGNIQRARRAMIPSVIRSATPADIPGLYQLALAYDRLGDKATAPWDSYRTRVEEILADPRMLLLIATAGSEILGYALAQDYGRNPRREFTTGRLHDLFVLATHRRRGFARQLMAAVAEWAKERRMILDWQSREEAVPFYESLGLAADRVGDQGRFPGFCLDFRP
jgi:GNAT superfamily N-acetyltransferase